MTITRKKRKIGEIWKKNQISDFSDFYFSSYEEKQCDRQFWNAVEREPVETRVSMKNQVSDFSDFYFSSYEEKTMKEAILWMPLSANLFRLESLILTRAKRATNRNNVATEKRSYIFFSGGFCRGDSIREPFSSADPLSALNNFFYEHLFNIIWSEFI